MKNQDKPVCNSCGYPRIIVNKKYGLCNACNSSRLKKLSIMNPSQLPKIYDNHVKKKRIPIRKKSPQRIVEERAYAEIRERKRQFQIEKRIYKCFFCNAQLSDTEDIKADCHHTLGRDGDLYCDWANLFFAHRECHINYHDRSVEWLMKTKWYLKFIDRLDKYNRECYNQEIRRLNKAGVIDNSQFLKMYKPEKNE